MPEKPQPDPIPSDEPPPHPAEPLQITTPVIDIQDLEHRATPDTRVSNRGVRVEPRVEPRMDSTDSRDLAREDEDALIALEQIEKAIRGQLPG
jgi:hypothetical protein